MKLKDFVDQFVNHNALVRLWERSDDGDGYIMIVEDALRLTPKKVGMAWAILDGSSWQTPYADYEVVCLPGIGIDRVDSDAVNICIRKPEEDTAEHPEAASTSKDEAGTTRAVILKDAMRCVCGGRDQDYGKPENSFGMIARLWSDYLGFEGITPKDVAIMMALLKIARIASSDNPDSFVDLAGYAACAGELAAEGHGHD